MNTHMTYTVCTYLVLALNGMVTGRVSMPFIEWLREDHLEIPDVVQSARTSEDLWQLCRSGDPFVRAAAVRQLGRVLGPEAVPRLVEISYSEQIQADPYAYPIVAIEAVRTIGRVGGEAGAMAIAELLEQRWRTRPENDDRALSRWLQRQTTEVVSLLHVSLDLPYCERLFQVIKTMAEDHQTNLRLALTPEGQKISEFVWMVYLRLQSLKFGPARQSEWTQSLVRFWLGNRLSTAEPIAIRAAKARSAERLLRAIPQNLLGDAFAAMKGEVPYAGTLETDLSMHQKKLFSIAYLERLVKASYGSRMHSTEDPH